MFQGKCKGADEVAGFIFWTVSEWASRDRAFTNVSMLDLSLS